jgi:autotransporter-associated beta strand protein
MKTNVRSVVAWLAAITMGLSLAQAATIPLNNASFETPEGVWLRRNVPDYWTLDFGLQGEGTAPVGHSGGQCVWNCWDYGWFSLSQQSTYTVASAGESLAAGVWVRLDSHTAGTASFNVILLLDGVEVATNRLDSTSNFPWTELTATYLTTAADVGKAVGLAFGASGSDTSGSPSYSYLDDASLTTVATGAPTASGTASPNPATIGEAVSFTVTVTPGGTPTLASVVLDATPIGGPGSVVLVAAGGNVFTNSVTVVSATAYGVPLSLVATAKDANGLTGEAAIPLTVNRPSNLTWGGGTGLWNDRNWLPYQVTGPTLATETATITNGDVTVNIPGGVGGVKSITLAGGLMRVHNFHYGGYANLVLAGGTLDTADESFYHAYGASILSKVTATGTEVSSIAASGGSWFNLDFPSSTFVVTNDARLVVSASLRGAAWGGVDDNQYRPSALIKSGAGILTLAGANSYAGATRVEEGLLSFDDPGAVPGGPLDLATGTKVDLNFSGTATVSQLLLGGAMQSGGTYGASGSGATYVNDTYFSGTGLVLVPFPPVLGWTNLGGGQLELRWEGGATLQVQTNGPGVGLTDEWRDSTGTSPVTVAVDAANGSVFYRLKQ